MFTVYLIISLAYAVWNTWLMAMRNKHIFDQVRKCGILGWITATLTIAWCGFLWPVYLAKGVKIVLKRLNEK